MVQVNISLIRPRQIIILALVGFAESDVRANVDNDVSVTQQASLDHTRLTRDGVLFMLLDAMIIWRFYDVVCQSIGIDS